MPLFRLSLALVLSALAQGCAEQSGKAILGSGAAYVAMGSSFAAGPGLGALRPHIDPRCFGSVQNYPHKLAQLRGFALKDVSCSGAKTTHILGPWKELPAQIDAVTADAQLVTVTIGGNDLNYIGGLIRASCATAGPKPKAKWPCGAYPPPPDAAAYAGVRDRLMQIANGVKERAPQAILVFVNYATVLPPTGTCARTPLTQAQADTARAVAAKLEQITRDVAQSTGAHLADIAAATKDHHACAATPWMTGYLDGSGAHEAVPYHITDAGMSAIANAVSVVLER